MSQNIRIFGDVAVVEMKRGFYAVIDEEDIPIVAQYRWSMSGSGYATAYLGGGRKGAKFALLHRFVIDARPGQKVDHRNRVKLDCRKANLREATDAQNAANKASRTNTYKGIFQCAITGKWRARIRANGRIENLGHHATKELAAEAYNRAAIALHGDFAYINQIEGS